ncbi:hypothetical protein [Bacteroides sp. 224]|uniref:hypothetical protein n=1 Tax=Bacteroides sp. 224 TaxID=2302936 RepID=UPI0013D5DE5F|nr:hypothetical protein [Bacteroides sp. 224]NDV65582.1 hypothetical protein [Bacteroides sp. 224]
MRKNIIKRWAIDYMQLAMVAAIALLFFACSEETDLSQTGVAPVSITAATPAWKSSSQVKQGIGTRTATNIKTCFVAGDEIDITVGNITTTATLQPDGTWQIADALNLPVEDSEVTLTAGYDPEGVDPLVAQAGTTDGSMILGVDANGRPVWNVTLNFTHRKALINVTVKDTDDNDITSQMQSISFVGNTSNTPTNILLYPTENLGNITVTVGDIVYEANSTARLKANTRYSLTFVCSTMASIVDVIEDTDTPEWNDGKEVYMSMGYDYVIKTADDLIDYMEAMKVPENLNKKAIQIADIDMSAESTPWVPIGIYDNPFAGVYNGNGYTITGFNIEATCSGTNYYAAMFGSVKDALLVGVNLRNCISKYSDTDKDSGGTTHLSLLVGNSRGKTTITLCSVQGKLICDKQDKSATYVGGLLGSAVLDSYTHISRCFADITVTGKLGQQANNYIGGLLGMSAGSNNNCNIVASGANINVDMSSTFDSIGGIAGKIQPVFFPSYVTYCYTTGTIKKTISTPNLEQIGGIVGWKAACEFKYNYSTVDIETKDNGGKLTKLGSLMGETQLITPSIDACNHAVGLVNGKTDYAIGFAREGKNMYQNPKVNFVSTIDTKEDRYNNITQASSGKVRTVILNTVGDTYSIEIVERAFEGKDVWDWSTGATPKINYAYNGIE